MDPPDGRTLGRMPSSLQQLTGSPAPPATERAMTEKGSPQDLEERMALVAPEATLRGFFFTGILAQVRLLGDEAVTRQCEEAAGGDRFMFFFSYPVSAMLRLLYTAAWALKGPRGDFAQVMRHLGQEIAPDYLESGTGRVLVLLAAGEPRRLLNGFPSADRTAVRHGDCTVTWMGAHAARVTIQGSPLPAEYYEGAVRGVFSFTQVAQVATVVRQVSPLLIEVDVSW
jgi:uncharacterized protein (TIGR02265 family)